MKIILLLLILSLISCKEEVTEPTDTEQRNDDGIILNISLSGSLQNPAFSPDGKSIVFTRFINGYNKEPAELYRYDLFTKQLTLLISDGSANVNLPGSAWNGAINQIVFSSSREPHDETYMIIENGSPGDEIKITDRSDSVAYEPTFSPNGEWIVFESHKLDEEVNGIIVKYKIDKSSPYIYLTDSVDDCRQPNWSPSGNKILYQKFVNGQWDIWIMNTDGTDKTKVTSGSGNKTDASFSNDGQLIIYSTDFELDLSNIYKIPVTSGTPDRLTDYTGYDGAPSLSPDGTKLIFESFNGDPDNSTGTKLILLNL
ncbi:tolB protein precursor, periplasmic protein involved in the tonb-independent uptake of group A colicins [hydrothermal vent metagenome]|uniref:TolB protein, periplasmic protein involved in the tonb-independent uptake of group A colicins n=1 Tax=hydrothermal vent metagenome TaxID=652676 RepID=A0A3B1BMS6_9ZZZZ